jgi:uncharacterized membrane protein
MAMSTLLVGIVLFFSIHTIPMLPDVKAALLARLGENRFKGIFSLFAMAGLVAIVFGMGSAPFQPVWTPPPWSHNVTNLAMPVAFCLLIAAYIPSNFRRLIRNPMMSGVLLWSLAHLLSNGDLASVLLFGSFGIFSVVDIISVNKRSAAIVPDKKPVYLDGLVIVTGLVAFWLVRYYHASLFGVAVPY